MNILRYKSDSQVREAIEAIAPGAPVRVLFVCLGNICRSPAAEGMMLEAVGNDDCGCVWEIDSAGTGRYHIGELPDSRMRTHARRRGLDLTHRCRQVRATDFADFDLVIGMDSANLSDLRRIAPTVDDEKKILPIAAFFTPGTRIDYVPDPYYEGAEGFELVLDLLAEATVNLRDTIADNRRQT